MYLSAGTYARNGERGRASDIYEKIISRFPKSSWSVKASDQLSSFRRSDESNRQSSVSSQQSDSGDFRIIGDNYTSKGEKREIWGNCDNGKSFVGHKWNFDNYWTVSAKTSVQDSGLSMDGAVRKACRGY
jgi:hypothetical protein